MLTPWDDPTRGDRESRDGGGVSPSRSRLADRWQRVLVQGYTRSPDRLRLAVLRLTTPGYRVGVLVVATRPDGRVLLVDQPYLTGWSLPGGNLRRGEDPHDGAVREVREELGVELELGRPELASARPGDRWVTFVVAVALDDAVADTLRPVSPEITGATWWHPDAMPEVHMDAVEPLRLAGFPAPH